MAAPAKPAKATKYSKLEPVQINIGLQVLYPNTDEPSSSKANKHTLDIVAIPGLGANPEWTWVRDKVHWLRDSNMLARKVPNARISVFQFQSQWFGKGAVDQRLENVADQLLYQLERMRGDNNKTPIIFISHCLGGIVLERALLTSRLRQNDFPSIFPSVAGCVFLGTPFHGTQTQSKAMVLADMAETIGLGVSSSLLRLLEKDSEVLIRMLDEFVRLTNDAQIRVFCFFESEKSDIAGVLLKKLPFKKEELVVDKESATYPGVESLQLASDHFKLNKYSGPKDGNFVSVSNEIKATASRAAHIIKSRQNTVRQALINDRTYHALIDTLGRGFSDLIATTKGSYAGPVAEKSSWVVDVDSFKQWKEQDTSQLIWVHGKAGTGQGAIASSVVGSLNKTKQANSIVASFFCDQSDKNRGSLRSMLKLLIRQIIDANQDLAVHLLTDSKKAKSAGKQDYDPEALNKIPALWEALQSMANDVVDGRIYIVIYGIDQLSKESLQQFLEHMKEIPSQADVPSDDDADASPIKWMLLSRSGRPDIEKCFKSKTLEINIDDSENAEHVSDALRSTISARVDELELLSPLTYFVKRHIHSRAEDNYIYVSLVIQELKNARSSGMHKHSEIRALLESFPFGLTEMFEHIRKRILSPTAEGIEYTKEILRCLILARRAPTLRELAIMADLPEEDRQDLELLKGHLIRCGAFLMLRGNEYDEDSMVVEWVDPAAQDHLEQFAQEDLALDGEKKDVQHGIIALRCLEYVYSVTEIYEAAEEAKRVKEEEEQEAAVLDHEMPFASDYAPSANGAEEEKEGSHEDPDEDPDDDNASEKSDPPETEAAPTEGDKDEEEHEFDKDDALDYPVEYWLEHAKLAPVDVIQEFRTGHAFWKDDSPARQDWWSVNDSMHVLPNQTNVTPVHVAVIAEFPAFLDHLLDHGWTEDVHREDSYGSQPLFCACAVGNYEIVLTLLGADANIDYVANEDNVTALSAAARRGHIEICECLLDRAADVNINSKQSGTALYAACESDHLPIIRLLLDRGKADVNLVGGSAFRALNWAAWNGNLEAVSLLLDHGADIDPEEPDYWYVSALGGASRRGHAEIVKLLLSRGWSPSKPMKHYGSFLTCAATYGHLGVVEMLVQKEARITVLEQALAAASQNGKAAVVKTILEKTPTLRHQKAFMLAADYGRDEVLKLLFARGIAQEKLDEALFLSADHEHESTVKLLLSMGASPNAEGPVWGCALSASAYDGTTEIMRALIEKGADVNKIGGEYGNPLQAAAWAGVVENVKLLLDHGALCNTAPVGKYGHALQGTSDDATIRLLLESGANVNAYGGKYGFAIIGAVEEGDSDALKIFLEHSANVNVRGGEHNSPVIATAGGTLAKEDLEAILDHGANVNDADDNGTTALINCADAGDSEGLEFLLSRAASVEACSETFGTALHAAAQNGDEDCCRILLKAGAMVNAIGGPSGTPLQAAASIADLETVQLLLAAGADAVGTRLISGTYGTPLQAACSAGNISVVRELVEDHGAIINMRPANGKHGFPLHAAAAAGAKDVVEYLLEHDADVSLEGGEHGYALLAAAQRPWNYVVVQALLDHGAVASVQGGLLGNAVAAAASVNNNVVLRTLLDAGASAHARGGKFWTSLQAVAIRATDMDCYDILFDLGVDVNATGGKYHNALIAAAYFDRGDAVTKLLDCGADFRVRGGKFMNAIAAAAIRGNEKILEKFLKMGPPEQLLDEALVEACAYRQTGSVESLLKSGASVYARHPTRGTALDALKADQADGYNSDDEHDDTVDSEDDEDDDDDEDEEESEDDEWEGGEGDAESIGTGSVLDLRLEDDLTEEAKIEKLLNEAMARVKRNPSIKRFRTVKRGGLPPSLKPGPRPQMTPQTSFQQFNPPNGNGPSGPQPQYQQQFSNSPRQSFQAYPGPNSQGGYPQQSYPPTSAAPYAAYPPGTSGHNQQSPPQPSQQTYQQPPPQPPRHPSQQSIQYPSQRPSQQTPQQSQYPPQASPQQMPQRVPLRTSASPSPSRKPVPGSYTTPPPPTRQYSSNPQAENPPQLPPRTGSQEQVSQRYSTQPPARQPLNPGPSGRYQQQQQPQRQSYASPQSVPAYAQPSAPPPQNSYASPPASTYNSPPMYNTPPPPQQYNAPPPPQQYNAPPPPQSQYQSPPPSQYNNFTSQPPSQEPSYMPYVQSSQSSSQTSFQGSQYTGSSQYAGSQQGGYGTPNSSQTSGFNGQAQGRASGQAQGQGRRWGGGGYDGEGYG